jgi:hypothetical protein
MTMAAPKKKVKKLSARAAKAKKDLLAIERAAKRAEQKEQGAFDGRFRMRVVKDKKKYSRKGKRKNEDIDPASAG